MEPLRPESGAAPPCRGSFYCCRHTHRKVYKPHIQCGQRRQRQAIFGPQTGNYGALFARLLNPLDDPLIFGGVQANAIDGLVLTCACLHSPLRHGVLPLFALGGVAHDATVTIEYTGGGVRAGPSTSTLSQPERGLYGPCVR